jgi:tetratricopeptide (TPR) repeat protein
MEKENSYRSLLARQPENAEALRGLARALMESGRFQESYAVLCRGLQAEMDSALNHHAMSELLSLMDASGMEQEHAGYSAQQEARATMQADPSFADAYRIMAGTLENRGELEQAIANMRQAVRLSPRTENYQLELANLELTERDYGSATALLRQLENSPDPRIAKQAEFALSSNVVQKNSNVH